MTSYTENQIEALTTELRIARENLVETTGGQSICSIHKYDSPSDKLKYNESKEFVLRRILRSLEKRDEITVINAFLEENETKFQAYLESDISESSSWKAYADGGLEGISRVREILDLS